MATPLLGTGYGLWIDSTTALTNDRPPNATNYDLLSCAIETGLDVTVEQTDTTNKCDNGNNSSIPGLLSWSFNWNGQAVSLDSGELAAKINYEKLLDIMLNKQVVFAKLTSTTDATYIREGKVLITSFNETQGNQAVFAVTATFTGTGELFNAAVTP